MDRPAVSSILELKQSCEEWLRAGKISLVVKQLSRIKTSDVPRNLILDFARLARRCNQVGLGLRFLRPLMTGKKGLGENATIQEKAEYGVLLQRYGSTSQALKILESLSPAEAPESLLYRSFCHFSKWEYGAALPLLETYVALPSLDSYQRLIGRVNLASVFVVLKMWEPAEKLLSELRAEARSSSSRRLLTNLLELSAQFEILRGEHSLARPWLEEGEGLLRGEDSLDTLFLEKWRGVLKAESGDFTALRSFRAKAEAKKHWESLREADLYLMKYTKDVDLCGHLYAGSPLEGYRRRILESAPSGFEPPSEFELGSGNSRLDISGGLWNGREILTKGQKIHLLLQFVLSDFYRPRRMATIFSEIFSDQNFDIFSSPGRVYQIVKRAREMLLENGIPLGLFEEKGNYHFFLPPGLLKVRLALRKPAANPHEIRLAALEVAFAGREFTAREARELLDLPLTSFHRWMQWALQEGHLVRIGEGSRSRYRIPGISKISA